MAKSKSISKKKVKKYQIEITPLSALLWGIFLFFLLTWIFVLGILVGRGFLPGNVNTIADLKSQISKLQQMIGDEDNKEIPQKPEKTIGDPELAFYEKLSSKKEEVKNKTEPVEKKAETINKSLPPKPEKTEKPSPGKEKEQKGLSGPDFGDEKPLEAQYTIQLASLGEKEKAEKLINELVDNGYPAYYYETNVNGKVYYRIRCGKFVKKTDANKLAGEIAKKQGIKGFVSRLE